jgi:hypothetical protein
MSQHYQQPVFPPQQQYPTQIPTQHPPMLGDPRTAYNPPPPPGPAKKPTMLGNWIRRIGAGAAVVAMLATSYTLGLNAGADTAPASTAAPSTAPQPPKVSVPTTPAAPAVVPIAPQPTGPARKLSAREWAQIAKSPDQHIGEHVVVYGHVTQFDAVTGTSAFRASLDGIRHRQTYEYDTNAILRARNVGQLDAVVQDDVIRAEVTITGSYSYETTMGGTMTAPQMQVEKIEVIG